jgi:hypothetical protein
MRKILAIAVLLLGVLSVSAQEVLSVSGDCFQGENANISFSLGETVTETFSANSNVLTQGFQQVIYPFSDIKTFLSGIDYRVFPNPAYDYTYFSLSSETNQPVNVSIYNSYGKHINTYKAEFQTTLIELNGLASGLYFLTVATGKETIKTLKIQKL